MARPVLNHPRAAGGRFPFVIAYAARERFPGALEPARRIGWRMAARDDDDRDLSTAFAARDRWAFEEAYRRYAGLLYAAAYNVLGEAEDARDAVHDALARVWRSPGAYTPARGALKSFLTVCVRNEAITRARAQNRRMRLASRLAAEPVEHDELRAGDPIEDDRLRRALTTLPAELRRPLELAYYDQLTHVEIARTLDTPLGTIKSRIANGLRKLGAALENP